MVQIVKWDQYPSPAINEWLMICVGDQGVSSHLQSPGGAIQIGFWKHENQSDGILLISYKW